MSADDLDNEDYQFDDMDLLASDPAPDGLTSGVAQERQAGSAQQAGASSSSAMTSVLRNGLVVVGVVVLLVVGYSVIESMRAQSKKTSLPGIQASTSNDVSIVSNEATMVNSTVDAAMMNAKANAAAISKADTSTASDTNSASNASDSQWQGQLSGLQQQQQSITNNMTSMTNKLSDVNGSVNQLSSQFSQLNQVLNALSAKLDQQSAEISQLAAMQKKIKQHAKRPPMVRNQTMAYALQAVIPGRAWIVAPDGTTLTVRKGSQVIGYGVVRSIDAQQGLVMTSSGRVIQFSQADS